MFNFVDDYSPLCMTQIFKAICVTLNLVVLFPVMKSYAQLEPSSTKQLEQLIREGGKSNFFNLYTILACNEDSLFFKNDTIRFYDNPAYYSVIGVCCEFIEWEFNSEKFIRQQEPQTCLDPSNLLVSSIRHYKYKIKKHKRKIFINIYTGKDEFESFRVQNIEYIELPGENNCRAITLIRQRPNDRVHN